LTRLATDGRENLPRGPPLIGQRRDIRPLAGSYDVHTISYPFAVFAMAAGHQGTHAAVAQRDLSGGLAIEAGIERSVHQLQRVAHRGTLCNVHEIEYSSSRLTAAPIVPSNTSSPVRLSKSATTIQSPALSGAQFSGAECEPASEPARHATAARAAATTITAACRADTIERRRDPVWASAASTCEALLNRACGSGSVSLSIDAARATTASRSARRDAPARTLMRPPDSVTVRPRTGKRARRDVEQHDAEAVEVAGHRAALPRQHLRRQIERRSRPVLDRRGLGVHLVAGAEVGQHDAPVVAANRVLRFHVPVE
jgi:hypothetical protein